VSKHKTDLPLVAFRLKKEAKFSIFELSDHLRYRGWQIPAYALAENCEHIKIMRVVVQESFSIDMADRLIVDIIKAIRYLEDHYTTIEDKIKSETKKPEVRSVTSFVHL